MSIKKITNEQRELMRQKSAQSLPDVPSNRGWTPKNFKDAITKPLFDNENSFFAHINSIVDSIDTTKVDKEFLFSNYYGVVDVDYLLSSKVDSSELVLNYYKKVYIDNIISSLENQKADRTELFSGNYNDLTNKPTLFSGYYNDLFGKPSIYNKDELDIKFNNYYDKNYTQNLFNNVYNTLNNYAIKNTVYTKEEVKNIVLSIPKFNILVVNSLPTSNISNTTVYLLRVSNETRNLYEEYIYVNNSWELLGTAKIDLSIYYTKNEIDSMIGDIDSVLDILNGEVV